MFALCGVCGALGVVCVCCAVFGVLCVVWVMWYGVVRCVLSVVCYCVAASVSCSLRAGSLFKAEGAIS